MVKAQDRGPVWLLTGFLNNYTPEYDPKMLEGVKPRHWRYTMWPYWIASHITADNRPNGRAKRSVRPPSSAYTWTPC